MASGLRSTLGTAGARPEVPALPALTSLRFFAAAYVLVLHAGAQVLYWAGAGPAVMNVVNSGWVAVSFFFVLSGFILTYNYVGVDGGRVDARRFLVARLSRIYPVYLLGNLLMLPFMVALGSPVGRWSSLLWNVLLVQAWMPSLVMLWNSPGWSISCEAFFYLVFPGLARGLGRPLERRSLVLGLVLVWLLGLLIPSLYMLLSPDGIEWVPPLTGPFYLELVKRAPLSRLSEFVYGAVLGRYYLLDLREERRPRAPGVLIGGAILASLAVLSNMPRWPFPMLHDGLLSPLFGLIIYGTAHSRGLYTRVLSWRPLVVLGDASYSLYILQLPLAMILLWALGMNLYYLQSGITPGLFPIYMVGMVGVSVLVFYGFERPLQRRLRRWLS